MANELDKDKPAQEQGSQDATSLSMKSVFNELGEELTQKAPEELYQTKPDPAESADKEQSKKDQPITAPEYLDVVDMKEISQHQPGYQRNGKETHSLPDDKRNDPHTGELKMDEALAAQADDKKEDDPKDGLSPDFILKGHSYL